MQPQHPHLIGATIATFKNSSPSSSIASSPSSSSPSSSSSSSRSKAHDNDDSHSKNGGRKAFSASPLLSSSSTSAVVDRDSDSTTAEQRGAPEGKLSKQQLKQQQQIQRIGAAGPTLQVIESAVASSCALIFSNPFELIKTRLQLQGELQSKAATRVVYRGMLHGVYRVATTEGPLALYQGLGAAAAHQACMNGLRFGMYSTCKEKFSGVLGPGMHTNVVAAAFIGSTSAAVSSPLFQLKTRMQAANVASKVGEADKLGSQYRYVGLVDGLKKMYVKGGIAGCYKGAANAALRTGVGVAAQLPVYDAVKEAGVRRGWCASDVRLHVLCGMCSASAMVACMTPMDTVLVRIYTGKRSYKTNIPEALAQVVRAEGFRGLYKGWSALLWRLGPHTIATWCFLEQLRDHRDTTSARVAPWLFSKS